MSRLVRASEIAPIFGVDAKTVKRWGTLRVEGFPAPMRTPGGHFRWTLEDIAQLARARGFALPETWTTAAAA